MRAPTLRMRRLLFGFIGVAVVAFACGWLWSVHSFTSRAVRASGVVTKLIAGGSHPEVAFVTATGEQVSSVQGGLIAGYREGERVDVLYLAEEPRNAQLDSFGALWGFPSLFLLLGVVFVGAGLHVGRR